jgi:hypothetical protein
MKKCILIFVCIVSCCLLYSQQILFNVGDDIVSYLEAHPASFVVQGQNLLNVPDGRFDFLKYKFITVDEDTKFLLQDQTVFGVMQCENSITRFLYDLNGDGVLDVVHTTLFLPYWILSQSRYTVISGENNVKPSLDAGMAMFNGNANPYTNPRGAGQYIMEMVAKIGPTFENRDLFYGLFQYYYNAEFPELAFKILSQIEIDYEARFGTVHPLILLHLAESLINMDEPARARVIINRLLQIEPDFVPAQVYRWQLEPIPALRQNWYNQLKAEHPEHWIVKQI